MQGNSKQKQFENSSIRDDEGFNALTQLEGPILDLRRATEVAERLVEFEFEAGSVCDGSPYISSLTFDQVSGVKHMATHVRDLAASLEEAFYAAMERR